MSIRVECPSCGRVGRGPEQAIGRKVQCPACGHAYALTPEMVLPEDVAPVAEAPAPRPATASSASFPRRPVAAPKPSRAEDVDAGGGPGGVRVPMAALVGGAIGVALLAAIGGTWAALALSRGRDAAGNGNGNGKEPPIAKAVAAADAPAPEAVADVKVDAPTPAPAPETAPEADPLPAVAPGEVAVAEAMLTEDVVPVAPPEVDPALAARAQAAAAAVASQDGGPGRTLTTADIVAESEPSVAAIQGKVSGGTGFLVAPGLIATNAHVIEDEFVPDLQVRFVSADGRHKDPRRAYLLFEDRGRDLALLAVSTDLKPLRLAKEYRFRKGEDVTVIGSPDRGDGQVLENAISRGVMSTRTEMDGRPFYQLNIAVNPGNSGGPVFDSAGRVIGVVRSKSVKQEATGFCIPIEDLHAALGKLARQSARDGEGYRSRHRLNTAVQGLGGGGALICLLVDLRRAAGMSQDSDLRELLGKLEPVVAELDREMFPSLDLYTPQVKGDTRVAGPIRDKVGALAANFGQLRAVLAGGGDTGQLRSLKQAHKRLLTELATALKLDIPRGMLAAFDDHAPSGGAVITVLPPGFGPFGSRLRPGLPRPGLPRPPIGVPRPPSRLRPGRLRGAPGAAAPAWLQPGIHEFTHLRDSGKPARFRVARPGRGVL